MTAAIAAKFAMQCYILTSVNNYSERKLRLSIFLLFTSREPRMCHTDLVQYGTKVVNSSQNDPICSIHITGG